MKTTISIILARKKIPVELDFDGKIIVVKFPYFAPLVAEVKSMKGAKWNPDLKQWSVENCKRNLFAFDILCNGSKIGVYDKKQIDLAPPGLWSHQVDIYQFIMTRHRCLIGAEPRTGKTRPTLQAFVDSQFKVCTWVSTKNSLLGIEREVFKWFKGVIHINDSGLISGHEESKVLNLVSYDKFTSIIEQMPAGLKVCGFWVFDECHKLKTPTAQRTEAAIILSDTVEDIYNGNEFVVGLSGTPAPKDPSDWWSQCEVIRNGYIREGDINKFRKRYGDYKPWDGSTPAWERFQGWNKREVSLLSQRLVGLVKVYFQRDCMDLPPIREEIVELTASRELLRVAKMIVYTEDSVLRARTRLRQIADGFEYIKEYNENTNKMEKSGSNFVGSPKIDQLKEDLDEYEAVGRVIVYAGFQGSIDIIRQTCLELGWFVLQIDGRGRFLYKPDGSCSSDKDAIQLGLGEMDRSADTKSIPKLAFVAEPDSGGTGLELSSSPVVIYYSNSDSGEGRMQSKKRAYSDNMDKERGLTVLDYLLLPTDRLILSKLNNKEELQSISMGQMKELFANIT
jgi:hypothetical protein